MKPISKLQYITTSAAQAEQACIGGVDWVQLRLKNIPYAEYKAIAKDVQAVCKQYNAIFIINDNVRLAMDIQADGVHVGKEDMLPKDARKMLGDNYIIGCSANTLEDIIQLSTQHIDYIGLGPYRFTNTKDRLSPVLGVEGYERIFASLHDNAVNIPPIIGIGGITANDVSRLLSTGLYGIAVSGAISNTTDITRAAKKIIDSINYQLQQ